MIDVKNQKVKAQKLALFIYKKLWKIQKHTSCTNQVSCG